MSVCIHLPHCVIYSEAEQLKCASLFLGVVVMTQVMDAPPDCVHWSEVKCVEASCDCSCRFGESVDAGDFDFVCHG